MKGKTFTLTEHYVDNVVEIHLRAFPNFFLSFLGPKFLREYYTAFVHERSGIAFVAKEEEKEELLLGVVVGTEKPAGFYRRLLIRRGWAFCLASVDALRKRPTIGFRLLRALFYRGNRSPSMSGALLSSIAVIPEAQGLGIGRLLANTWLNEVHRRGIPICYLTTDAENNEAVNSFYLQGGWRIDSVFKTPEGRKMNRYVYVFKDNSD
jgi:ribosomal protein S18 acetylase RimI-like enzyme